MNSFTNTILTLMLGWLRTLLNVARDFVSSDSSTAFFDFFRNNWRILFLVLCVVGFAMDKIVYLIRWRPRLIWRKQQQTQEYAADLPAYDEGAPSMQPDTYPQDPVYTNESTAPTMQYQMQPTQANTTRPASPPATTPYFAPAASQNAYQTGDTALPLDETMQEHAFAPASETNQRQRFAFDMAPSFGSAQSEPAPAYHYPQNDTTAFTPPQYSQKQYPPEPVAPAPVDDPLMDTMPAEPPAYAPPSPYFRPFSDRETETFAPPKARGLGAVARKARNLLSSDEELNALSYQDVQPTVDVSRAFHSPVYPEKKPEGNE